MLKQIREKVYSGKRLTGSDGLKLFRTDDIFTLGELASYVSKKKNGRRVYFIQNLHVNPTNICVNRCRFCAFSRSQGEDGAFALSIKEIIQAIRRASDAQPLREVHIVGGLHPDWPFQHYLEMIKQIRKAFPSLHIKAFTATEVDHMQRMSGLSLEDVLQSLKRQGIDFMPGGGAEIFHKAVRQRLCPEKLSGERWLEVMEAAHRAGIRTNATMLYGHIEGYEHRVDHLLRLRGLQDKTGGFQTFIPLCYHPKNTAIGGSNLSGIDDLKTIAVSRLLLDNFQHIKAYWVMQGEKVSQLALHFGADDIDGTVMEEKITHAAGGESKKGMTKDELVYLIKKAGKTPVERDSSYRSIR